MNRLQEQFDRAGAALTLSPGEYEGPLRVTRPCVLDGGGSTLWAMTGPVLVVESPGVTVRNLRVEITEAQAASHTAIQMEQPAALENVEVRGDVVGLPGEAPHWDLPALVSLGEFAAGTPNAFSVQIQAAAPAELICGMEGVTASPARLEEGPQTFLLQAEPLRDNTILYGELLLRTAVTRRLCVTGLARKGAPERREAVPAQPVVPRDASPVLLPAELLAPQVSGVPYVKRGQRLAFQDLGAGTLKVALEHQGGGQDLELDAYMFLLGSSGKVRGDSDFVFFGNPVSPDQAVRLASAGKNVPLALADLDRVDPAVERLAVCFSVYGDEAGKNFSRLREPLLRIFAGEREACRLRLDDLRVEKTLVAVEVYRYKGQWKLNFVGSGYQDGLRPLCESYGVEVEN
ncbi:MAG: hypothetical protein HFG00_06075 [Oscillibacter sp.]|nr:hypothetical protein [Oscillibacter sp.]